MPTMERIPISEWEWGQAAKSSHATPSAIAALAITKNDDNDNIAPDNIAPTVSACRSDSDYPTTAQPDADDTPQRPDDTNSSAAACPIASTLRSTTSSSPGGFHSAGFLECYSAAQRKERTCRERKTNADVAEFGVRFWGRKLTLNLTL